jgi:coproporphyrinogen III oxidase
MACDTVACVGPHLFACSQAAVNVSLVSGTLSAERAAAMSSRGRGVDPGGGQRYSAAALSLVYHPAHPFVPTLRADVRRFQVLHF